MKVKLDLKLEQWRVELRKARGKLKKLLRGTEEYRPTLVKGPTTLQILDGKDREEVLGVREASRDNSRPRKSRECGRIWSMLATYYMCLACYFVELKILFFFHLTYSTYLSYVFVNSPIDLALLPPNERPHLAFFSRAIQGGSI